MKTIEEKAKAYADEIKRDYYRDPFSEIHLDGLGRECRDAYLAGATEALAGQWRNIEDETPDGTPFCVTLADEESRLCLCHYDGDVFIEDYSGMVCAVKYWMPIPYLPPKDESE